MQTDNIYCTRGADIFVIGCGGIGGFLLNMLPQTMACIAIDSVYKRLTEVLNKTPKEASEVINEMLATEGIPEVNGNTHLSGHFGWLRSTFSSLNLIDGDVFSGHNALRQAAISGSKLSVQLSAVRKQDAFSTWLHDCKLCGYNTYVTPSNISKILKSSTINYNKFIVVFLCVDNHKTRYEVTRYVEDNVRNCLLINGGNNKTSGNVTVFEKLDGVALDPPIYKIYPEVNPNTDKRPDEVSCGEVALSNDQTAITNSMIASVMLNLFRKRLTEGMLEKKTRRKDPKTGENIKVRTNEIIIDLDDFVMSTLERSVKLDNRPKSIIEGEQDEIDEDKLI